MSKSPDRPISSLVFAELYEAGSGEFADRLLAARGSLKPLVGLIERWKRDARPWARALRLRFIRSPDLASDHRVVFKRFFKQAWADRDHEAMTAFAVVLDGWIRRKRSRRTRWDAGAVTTTEVLYVPPMPHPSIFSVPTTHYLRRRAWRYFRRLGFADPTAYVANVAAALVEYGDDDVRAGENLIDNWTLMHACFGKSPQLAFNARHTNLAVDGRLSELSAAPMFERHWRPATSASTLVDVLLRARCRPVRVWAIQLLRRHHESSLANLDAELMLRLLDHADVDVATFAADLLKRSNAVAGWPMPTWMRLLDTRNPSVVALIVEAFRQHVSLDRPTVEQAAELAARSATPVASLGLDVLATRAIRSPGDLEAVASLAAARCAAVAPRIAAFALPVLNAAGRYRVDQVVAFFDSALRPMREGAFAALGPESPAANDPAFWARLFESPYDDVRAALVKQLATRRSLPGASADALGLLWRSVLLNVHRGGRAKLTALRQVSDAIARDPAAAGRLMPVVAIAIRSVRGPEARHGLAAIVGAVERVPSLASQVAAALPELQMPEAAGASQ